MIEAATVNAISKIMLLRAIKARCPGERRIHLFVDNARYHHARLVQAWLARPGWRIKLHFIPTYCLHLDPIERLFGLMHKHVTHNQCHATFADACAGKITQVPVATFYTLRLEKHKTVAIASNINQLTSWLDSC